MVSYLAPCVPLFGKQGSELTEQVRLIHRAHSGDTPLTHEYHTKVLAVQRSLSVQTGLEVSCRAKVRVELAGETRRGRKQG